MLTILVVDDDAAVLDVTKEILEYSGYKTVSASDGMEAWEILQKQPVDMAVLDLNMPRMNGLELMRKIRSQTSLSRLPILLLTVRQAVEDQVSGYDQGADDYLTKPFDSKMLLARIHALERRCLDK